MFEAALRAEARKLEDALSFLRSATGAVDPGTEVRAFDPVPHVVTRRAGYERAQVLIQSGSRTALQAYLSRLSEHLFDAAPRTVRWHWRWR